MSTHLGVPVNDVVQRRWQPALDAYGGVFIRDLTAVTLGPDGGGGAHANLTAGVAVAAGTELMLTNDRDAGRPAVH